jgi:hypothetical protein
MLFVASVSPPNEYATSETRLVPSESVHRKFHLAERLSRTVSGGKTGVPLSRIVTIAAIES